MTHHEQPAGPAARMPWPLYIATGNAGKRRDFAAAAELSGFSILPLPGLGRIPEPPEDQPTFAGNARGKAIYYSSMLPGQLVLADDSGLEAAGLGGAPGVRSARYAADGCFAPPGLTPDARNNLRLLRELTGVANRSARYVCALAAARDACIIAVAEGSVEGQILTAPRGGGGFGYDPLFYLPALGCTMAELSGEEKWKLSHRGRAFRALLPLLQNVLQSGPASH